MTPDEEFFQRANRLMARFEALLPAAAETVDWSTTLACRWIHHNHGGHLQALEVNRRSGLDDVLLVDRQKQRVVENTLQFLHRLPANNVLLWGPRGTGKSSLIRALLNDLHEQGLRLVEVAHEHLQDLPQIVAALKTQEYRFILYCDDLSFEAGDSGYKPLKVVLDGALDSSSDNILVYATSNRRHLVPESMQDNRESRLVATELHHNEAIEEKISLSERFGLWLAFHPFNQEQYLTVVRHWLERLGCTDFDQDQMQHEALQWALKLGSRSGRSAWHFARDWSGRMALEQHRQQARG